MEATMSDPAHPDARPAEGYSGDLTPQQAWDLLAADPDAVLVDVRTDGEWRTIGVPDTSSLGKHPVFSEWVQAGGRPNPDFLAELQRAGVTHGPVVYRCRSGLRSTGAARLPTAAALPPSDHGAHGFRG